MYILYYIHLSLLFPVKKDCFKPGRKQDQGHAKSRHGLVVFATSEARLVTRIFNAEFREPTRSGGPVRSRVKTSNFLGVRKTQKTQVIQFMTFWLPLVGGHLTFEGVTFSPSQKGHQQNCQDGNPFIRPSLGGPIYPSINIREWPAGDIEFPP